MIIDDSKYNTKSYKYEFSSSDLDTIATNFSDAKDSLEYLSENINKTISEEIEDLGESTTRDEIEAIYTINKENINAIMEMCDVAMDKVNEYIDKIEEQLGNLSGTTRFDVEDVREPAIKINSHVTTTINMLNSKCVSPNFYTSSTKDQDKKDIIAHNKQVYRNLTNRIPTKNSKILNLIDDMMGIITCFNELSGNWCHNFGRDIELERLEFTNFKKFEKKIKKDNPELNNLDIRTEEEQKHDKISNIVHGTLDVIELGAAGISLVFPPAATVSVAAAGINGVLYSAEGEYTSAAFSFFSAAPVFAVSGWVSKEGAKVLNKVNNITSKIKFPTGAVDEVGSTFSKSMDSVYSNKEITTKYGDISWDKIKIKDVTSKYDNMSWNQIKAANQNYDNIMEITVKPVAGVASSTSNENSNIEWDSINILGGMGVSKIDLALSCLRS